MVKNFKMVDSQKLILKFYIFNLKSKSQEISNRVNRLLFVRLGDARMANKNVRFSNDLQWSFNNNNISR